MQNLKMESLHN